MSHIPQIKLFRPDGTHKAFRICVRHPDGTFKTLKIEELQLVNKRLKLGLIGIEEAGRLAEKIKEGKVAERDRNLGLTPLLFTSDNEKVYAEYKKAYEERNVKERSKQDWLRKMRRAIGSLQGLSIAVASRAEMTEALRKCGYSANTHNQMVSCLNSILKWQGRNVKLWKVDDDGYYIRYIGQDDFNALVRQFNRNEQLLMTASFATGMRLGEVVGAEPRRVKRNPKLKRMFYYVERQWHFTENGYRPPKRGKRRDTAVMMDYEEAFLESLELSLEERLEAAYKIGERVRDAARSLWPKHEDKHVSFHDLRHSYATNALAAGLSLSHVARFLGNGLKVTEDYYASYTFSDDIYALPAF